jgi:hypothetical protein
MGPLSEYLREVLTRLALSEVHKTGRGPQHNTERYLVLSVEDSARYKKYLVEYDSVWANDVVRMPFIAPSYDIRMVEDRDGNFHKADDYITALERRLVAKVFVG